MKKFHGLSQKEAKKRLSAYGFNELKEINRISAWLILFRQVRSNFVVYLLFASAVMSFLVGKDITGYAIGVVILAVVGSGFIQEYKAEKAIKALKSMIMPVAIAVRDGRETEVPVREIVPGDLLIIRTGEKIPADAVVLEESDLRVNEAILTGEAVEVKKEAVCGGRPDEINTIYMGACAVAGKCAARVLKTGMRTKFGKIAKLISQAEKELPLQKKVNRIAKFMVCLALTVSFLTGAVMLKQSAVLNYETLVDIMIVVIALSVSAFPEGFPVVLISTLASGAYRMAGKNAIVNRMSIIETLGETTLICTDKTGTLTKGEMTVRQIFCDERTLDLSGAGYEAVGELSENGSPVKAEDVKSLKYLLKTSVLCNDAVMEKSGPDMNYHVSGSPTEASLLIMAAKLGIFREDLAGERISEIPFSSEKKMMAVRYHEPAGELIYVKGAPEVVLENCRFRQKGGKAFKLGAADREAVLAADKRFTDKAARVLALAYKKAESAAPDDFEKNLVFLGLAAIEDPPRDEVKDALISCKQAGIRVKMITGDSAATAVQIGREVGLKGALLTGAEIDKLNDEALEKKIGRTAIFARVRPEHKLRLVSAFKRKGEIVTMTGDGVNDAPALKESHIGVAMGRGGTDVTREVADLILKDDNFATIVTAVKEGRTIFNNIQKFVTYQLSCNFAELLIVFAGILLGLPLPLLALQILFMNLVTDNLPAISLGFNRSSRDIMVVPPRRKSDILTRNLVLLLALAGTAMGLVTLAVYAFALKVLELDLAAARTLALLTLIFMEIANAFNFRSFRQQVLTRSPFTNRYLVYASLASLLATAIVIYTPASRIFSTAPLSAPLVALALTASFAIILVFDILKRSKAVPGKIG